MLNSVMVFLFIFMNMFEIKDLRKGFSNGPYNQECLLGEKIMTLFPKSFLLYLEEKYCR